MKLNNTVLYSKGWYGRRPGGCKNMWMDFVHTIDADGWTMLTKQDVVDWCLFRLDDLRKDKLFKYTHMLDFYNFFNECKDIIRRDEWHYNEGIDMNDAIILAYRSIISNTDRDWFTEGVRPNDNVLPFNYHPAYYSDGRYRPDNKPSFTFADMRCDIIDKINESFAEYPEQEIEAERFKYVESMIHGKSWKDVWVLCGTDSLLDCKEMNLTGKVLKNGMLNEDDTLDLNIYENCVDIYPDKLYTCRVALKKDHDWLDWKQYEVRSILKEMW